MFCVNTGRKQVGNARSHSYRGLHQKVVEGASGLVRIIKYTEGMKGTQGGPKKKLSTLSRIRFRLNDPDFHLITLVRSFRSTVPLGPLTLGLLVQISIPKDHMEVCTKCLAHAETPALDSIQPE